MNYVTNYYKNLSEQLQEKLNLLEYQIKNLQEDLTPGTIVQGYGTSNNSTTTNQDSNPDLNAFLQAWGSSNSTYDYNGDGVVDGNDLGIFLSNMISAGKQPGPQLAQPLIPGGSGVKTPGSGRTSVSAIDQPGTVNGADFGSGGPSTPGNPGTPDVRGPVIPRKPPYSGPGRPPQPPQPPSGPDTPDVGGPVIPRKPPYSGPGRPTQPPTSGGPDVTQADGPVVPYGPYSGPGRPMRPPVQPPPTGPKTRKTDPTATGIATGTGVDIGSGTPPSQPPVINGINQEGVPYWMSQRTTQADSSFRDMQRRRKF